MSANQKCAACGQSFPCDIAAGKSTCWCFELPQKSEVPDSGASCLCLRCLKAKLEAIDQPSKS
ncbi:MAG: cysteine-rich CWC family protein [Limisphaerales bacterium]